MIDSFPARRRIRPHWCLLTMFGCYLSLNALAGDPDDWHKNLEESGRKSEAARSIEQGYVKTLGLQGKSAAQAIEILTERRISLRLEGAG